MKSIVEYKEWLNDLKEKSNDVKIKMSIQKLTDLLNALESKKEFHNGDIRILERLEKLVKNTEEKPHMVNSHIDSCSADIITIAAKFYKLVSKKHYQNEWMTLGTSIGLSFGVVIWLLSNDVVYFPLGISLGIVLGMAYGSELDKKALNEGRQLIIE